jgi:hypothetical protein
MNDKLREEYKKEQQFVNEILQKTETNYLQIKHTHNMLAAENHKVMEYVAKSATTYAISKILKLLKGYKFIDRKMILRENDRILYFTQNELAKKTPKIQSAMVEKLSKNGKIIMVKRANIIYPLVCKTIVGFVKLKPTDEMNIYLFESYIKRNTNVNINSDLMKS